MTKLRFLFSDNFHLNQRNFASLYAFVEKTKTPTRFATAGRHLWNRYALYSELSELDEPIKALDALAKADLWNQRRLCCGVETPLFRMCRSEILTYVLATQENWINQAVSSDDEALFEKLWNENRNILIENMAAVWRWCDIYSKEIYEELNVASHCLVFSGSQIYQRILLHITPKLKAQCIVLESFQTGTEYYFEETCRPIANNCSIRFDNIYSSIKESDDWIERHSDRNKAINKMLNAQNKNVVQPADAPPVNFSNNAPILMLSCQVQNDFSIIESNLPNINASSVYQEFLDEILSRTKWNVIVKTHPWEKKKIHLRTSFMYERIKEFMATRSESDQSRVFLVEDANIQKLMDEVDAFFTLNSQSAFEACLYAGLRPITLGKPFYGSRGFTTDYTDSKTLAEDLANERTELVLSIEAYEQFLEFMTKMLQRHLVCVFPSGIANLRARLEEVKFTPIGIRARAALAPQKLPLRVPKKISSNETGSMLLKVDLTRRQRLLKKLHENPYRYFQESNYIALRPLKFCFSNNAFGRCNREILRKALKQIRT